jgi:hypothetical protein
MQQAAPRQQQLQQQLGLAVQKQRSDALVSVCLQRVWECCSSWGVHNNSRSTRVVKMTTGMRLQLVCSLASGKPSAGGSRGQRQQQLPQQTQTVMGSKK